MSARAAVLLIDVQASFEQRPYWSDADLPAFRNATLALLDGARRNGLPVVRILHEEAEGHFSLASGLRRPMDWLPQGGHAVEFVKHVHNAFTDTGLEKWLRERGIARVLIAGIRTEQCCETTARVASDLGFEADFLTEATLTFAMTHAGSGRRYDAAELKERTELVLDGRFARIRSVEEALSDVGTQAA